ncbi:MAG: lipoprotein-releasing ABC transporter permease subunit [Candidatus Omnitrophica bacterium]|nr:lipoprotein-releasing ABC transporter permease subunit [Candidatus Omnitrophota bacterium]
MPYEWWIGVRYLFAHSKARFISLISLISIIGVAVGVATLIIVIGVMTGFDQELRTRIIGTSSHLVVDKLGGIDDAPLVQQRLQKLPEVRGSAPFVNAQALLIEKDRMFSVLVRGIDPEQEIRVTDLPRFMTAGSWRMAENGLLVGKDLAARLGVIPGDRVQLLTPATIDGAEFVVNGVFSSGMYDYDANVIFVPLAAAQSFTEQTNRISGISVKLADVNKAGQLKTAIQEYLGFPYIVRSWMDLNRNLFDALKLEKTAMFIILTLIVLVASLNIASTLIMTVMEKIKDIGILKTIGATPRSIQGIFTLLGAMIGIVGTSCGVALGTAAAFALKTYKFIKLPKDVYYIDTLPVQIAGTDIVWIVGAALLISLGATIYPARQAARLHPVEALRYE